MRNITDEVYVRVGILRMNAILHKVELPDLNLRLLSSIFYANIRVNLRNKPIIDKV